MLAAGLEADSGIDDLLLKPVSQEQLTRVLWRWAGSGTTASAEPAPAPVPELLRRDLYQELVKLVERLHRDLSLGDLASFRDQAHQLAGLSGYFELRALVAAVRGLDRLAAAGAGPEQLRPSLERVKALLDSAGKAAEAGAVEPPGPAADG
jgi:HPt (histidine-containing phosphotransfer) domain-containing protein